MASMAMSLTTSLRMSKWAPSSPLVRVGLGPNANVLPMSRKSKTDSRRLLLAVKAQQHDCDLPKDYKIDITSKDDLNDDDLRHTYRFELTPWDYKEEANKIKMWFDMPGVAVQDIRVYVKDRKLFIQGKHVHLPTDIRKEDITATLGNGVLYVVVPKTKPEYEPHPIVIQPVSW